MASSRTVAGGGGDLAEQLATILTAVRESRGLSRRQLANDLGKHPVTLRELEVNHRGDGTPSNPTLRRVDEVAEWYGIELELVAKVRR